MHRFPSFLIAFAQICTLLLPEFWEKAMGNSGKTNAKFGQKQWENLGRSNEKTRKAAALFRIKIIAFARISIAFSRISHCFFPNFPLLLPEFPMAFARISHCFCPIFSFSFFFFFFFWGGGHSAPCPPPPPPTPMPPPPRGGGSLAHTYSYFTLNS